MKRGPSESVMKYVKLLGSGGATDSVWIEHLVMSITKGSKCVIPLSGKETLKTISCWPTWLPSVGLTKIFGGPIRVTI